MLTCGTPDAYIGNNPASSRRGVHRGVDETLKNTGATMLTIMMLVMLRIYLTILCGFAAVFEYRPPGRKPADSGQGEEGKAA
ncbi:MAG: hypothetical protein AAB932_05395 [Patescibacteria group bacterium]